MVDIGSCAVCDSALCDAQTVFVSNRSFKGAKCRSSLVECSSCTHVMLNPRPDSEELTGYYGDDYHCYVEMEHQTTDSQGAGPVSVERFNHVPVVKGGRYLDIGCGIGNMVAGMAQQGMTAEGVEPSEAAARMASQLGRKVVCGTLEDAHFPDEHFDCMSMSHVLEHIADPRALLAECSRILKRGGHFMIGVPNFDSLVFSYVGEFWVGLQLPTHLHHFRMNSLRRLVTQAGFAIEAAFSESLVNHVEGELVSHIRRRYKIPARLLLKTGVVRPFARKLATAGEASGRGEALVFYLRKPAEAPAQPHATSA